MVLMRKSEKKSRSLLQIKYIFPNLPNYLRVFFEKSAFFSDIEPFWRISVEKIQIYVLHPAKNKYLCR